MEKSTSIPITDIEESNQEKESIENVLNSIGDALNHASEMLDHLEQDGMLGPAIRRYASDLALVVGNVARDIHCGDEEEANNQSCEQTKWARAIIQDAQNQLALEENLDANKGNERGSDNNTIVSRTELSAAAVIAELNEDDVVDAMKAAKSILLDIEDALKDISVDDAEEIADVGLVVAKMFLWGLQNVQNQVVHTMITNGENNYSDSFSCANSSLEIEIMEENNDEKEGTGNQTNTNRQSNLKDSRIRVLWPPIGPAVVSVASWGKNEAVKNPILSIALAMALWPTAVVVAFIGAPILTIDYALQAGYNAVEDQPVIQNLEKSASNLCQVGKLYFLISKLMVKQSVRVGKRQIERRGGIGKIAEDFGHWTIDRAIHPIDSIHMAWNTFNAGIGMVSDAIAVVKDAAMGDMDTVHLNIK